MIIKMTQARIYGPKELLDSVTRILYDMGVLHIQQLPPNMIAQASVKERMIDDREGVRERVEVEALLEKVKKAVVLLPRPAEDRTPAGGALTEKDLLSPELAASVDDLFKKVEEVSAREKELKDKLNLLRKYTRIIQNLMPVVTNLPDTQHLEMVGLTIDRKNEEVLKLIEAELLRITGGNFHVFSSPIDEETVAAVLAFGKSYAPKIKELLWEKNLNEIKLPTELENLPLTEALQAINVQTETLPHELKQVEQEIAAVSGRWYFFLAGLKEALEGKLQQMSTSSTFFRTRYSFVVGGWLPKKSLPELNARMEKQFGGQVIVEEVPITEHDKKKIPVHMVNPPFVRPFEVFIKLLPLPVYGTIDATPFFAFFFPLFFGFIVGDIGYGLIALALALFLRSKYKANQTVRDLGTVLSISSVYAVVFGIIFGELFGDFGEIYLHMHPITPMFNRLSADNMIFFLSIAVVVGFIHVFLGIALGIINAILGGHRKHLIFKIAQFASLLSLSVLIAILAGVIDRAFMWPTAIILGAGVVVLTVTEGFIAPIELLSAMGNILSYARLMAVGLSGVILAFVGNKLGRESSNVVLGIAIALVFHTINMALIMFSPTIHSMRLHLVEFFTKFYESGGTEYKPFKKHGR